MNITSKVQRWLPICGCVAVAASIIGYGGATLSSAATASVKGKKVVFIAGDKNDPFYITLDCGAQREARKFGLSLSMQAPTDFDPSEQTPIVDAVAATNPAAVLIAPTDAKAMFEPIHQLAQGGVRVVFVDTTLNNPADAAAAVSTDDYTAGVQAAQQMSKLLHGKGQILIINLQAGVSTTDARGKGFTAGAKKAGLQVVSEQYAGNSQAKAASIAEATLARYPHLAGIFAATDFGAEGAVTALRGAELLGKVKIVGFDASPVMVSYLKAGSIQSIAAQQAQQIGVDGIDQAVKALEGKPTTKTIDLPAVTITKATLNSTAAKATLQSLKCNGA